MHLYPVCIYIELIRSEQKYQYLIQILSQADHKMDIVMMGDSNAGRTSIAKMIVQKIVSKQTMMLVQTSKMEIYDFKIHKIDFKLYDFPTKYDLSDPAPNEQMIFKNAAALVYVMNPQKDTMKSLENFMEIYQYLKTKNTNNCQFFIFINKKDLQLTDQDLRDELLLKHKKRLIDENIEYKYVSHSFTSILDYSIYEQFSKVIQKILPCTPYLCKILNRMANFSKISKIFVYDIYTKLFIAHNDQILLESYKYQLCSEMVDIYNDILSLYQSTGDAPKPNPNNPNQQMSKDKCQINMEFGKSDVKDLFKLQRVNSCVCICYIIKQSNYDRPYLIDKNIDTIKTAVVRYLNETTKFLS